MGQPSDGGQQGNPHLHRVMTRSHKAAEDRLLASRIARRHFMAKLAFTACAMSAAVTVWAVDRHDGEHHLLWGVPLFVWLLILSGFLPMTMLASILMLGFLFLLEGALSHFFENVAYVLLGLHTGLQCDPLRCQLLVQFPHLAYARARCTRKCSKVRASMASMGVLHVFV
jgi:hypothetical protein